MRDTRNKVQMLRLMVNELCDNIEAREGYRYCFGTYPAHWRLKSGQSKTQILNDIRKCRRTLIELWHLVNRQI